VWVFRCVGNGASKRVLNVLKSVYLSCSSRPLYQVWLHSTVWWHLVIYAAFYWPIIVNFCGIIKVSEQYAISVSLNVTTLLLTAAAGCLSWYVSITTVVAMYTVVCCHLSERADQSMSRWRQASLWSLAWLRWRPVRCKAKSLALLHWRSLRSCLGSSILADTQSGVWGHFSANFFLNLTLNLWFLVCLGQLKTAFSVPVISYSNHIILNNSYQFHCILAYQRIVPLDTSVCFVTNFK